VERASDAAGPTFALALAAALWSSSGYVGAFIPAANVVWDVDEARPLLKKLAVRLLLTCVLLVVTACASARRRTAAARGRAGTARPRSSPRRSTP
jgi:membrane protein